MKKFLNFILGLCLFGSISGSACTSFTKRTIQADWVFKKDATIEFFGREVHIPAGSRVVSLETPLISEKSGYYFSEGGKAITDILLENSLGHNFLGPKIRYISLNVFLNRFKVVFPEIK